VAGADYYPFGLPMDGREITDEDYRWGYQGQYAQENDSTGWNEFQLRMYDARFGRWLSADPYGQFWSPYVGMGNAPNLAVDPNGGIVTAPPRIIRAIEDIIFEGQLVAAGTTVLNAVTTTPSFFSFLEDLDAMYSGKLGLMFWGDGIDPNVFSGRDPSGMEVIPIDVSTFNEFMSLHKEWNRPGRDRSNNHKRTVENDRLSDKIDYTNKAREAMDKFYDALQQHQSKLAKKAARVHKTKNQIARATRDSLVALELEPGHIHFTQDSSEATIWYKPEGDWSKPSVPLKVNLNR
jgi:RHS repeat-associated protein